MSRSRILTSTLLLYTYILLSPLSLTWHDTEVPENNLCPHIMHKQCIQAYQVPLHFSTCQAQGIVWGCFTCEGLDVLSPLWWYVQGFTNLGCVLTVRDSRQLGFLPGAHALETIPAMHCYHTEDLYGGCNFVHWNATQVEPIGLAVCTLNLNYHFQVFGYLGFFSCTHARTHQQLLVHQRILES